MLKKVYHRPLKALTTEKMTGLREDLKSIAEAGQ